MILAPKEENGLRASAWIGGIALSMLLIGVHGATQPLLPQMNFYSNKIDRGDEVFLEAFNPPAPASEQPSEPEKIDLADIDIPLLPALQPPLRPPEMVEIMPIEELPQRKPMPPTPMPKAQTPPKTTASRATGASDAVTTFTGGGGGRFPSPPYPAAARSNKEQGTVKLLVTVEANGLPSAVTIQSSSGSAALDAAARDHIIRRWRWPSGEMRRYLVPVQFVLQR